MVGGSVGVSAAAEAPVKVHPSDLGPEGPWYRFQDDPSNAGKAPGTQEISPEPDPVHFNGSLHLAVKDGQQAQAAHYFTGAKSLSTLLSRGISYRAYVDSAQSSITGYGPNLQLPSLCLGAFTTLSFEPNANTDTDGHQGMAGDTWQKFEVTKTSLVKTSRTIPGVAAAGATAPLGAFAQACAAAGDGAFGVIANVGTLGSADASLGTYVDDITIDGSTYDFAVTGTAHAALSTPAKLVKGKRAGAGTVDYTNPADGPRYPATGSRLVFKGPKALAPKDLRITAQGRPVQATKGPNGSLVVQLNSVRRAGADLAPSGKVGSDFQLAATRSAPVGKLSVQSELTVTAASGDPVGTGVRASDTTMITAPRPSGPVDTGVGGTATETR
ncbi:hypothetical protein [Streptomyces endophyticus]|uniref:Htaa domain-containing protein n=1 Tax=Streptomyces endophyticus TaxID=714166 RepID=A0ABU6FD38_9ACTN|nr:hypothetical protein [Streptomyces endophyticus]MEB8341950.1 hypothetical protein [Streptomyces endophyticus]